MKPGKTLYSKSRASNQDIRKLIDRMIPVSVVQTKSMADRFRGLSEKESAQKIWNFLKNDINYIEDDENQVVKSPSALIREKSGDCKSYALFTSGVLTNLGIPHHLVYTSYSWDPTPSHVYVETESGIIIDGVWKAFNSEKKPKHRYERKILKGSSKITGVKENVLPLAIGLGAIYFLTRK
jgi:hypothetical protein